MLYLFKQKLEDILKWRIFVYVSRETGFIVVSTLTSLLHW